MALGQRLEVRQGQSLVMTPQLQQAIKLLQLSNRELTTYVENELERNPLLSRNDGEAGESDGPADEQSEDAPLSELSLDGDTPSENASAALDADFESVHPEAPAAGAGAANVGGSVDWSKAGGGGYSEDGSPLDSAAAGKTLAEHLSDQLAIAARDQADRFIGAALIDLVDDDGYFRADLIDVAQRLGADAGRVEGVLALCQTFEPTGVMARDLAECLSLQLKERDRFDPAMQALVANLSLLADHNYKRLLQLCGVDEDDLADMIGELRALTPKPGLSFTAEAAAPIEPDVYVREKPDGGWVVELNTDTLPRVLVDSRYYAEVSSASRNEADRAFITECHQNANWLVKSLDQRARTILKVASEIVRQQDGFFAKGVEHLRPLNLKTVADAISMHESTVSRVTSNKYIASPRGLFELKFFFTAAIPAAGGGEAHSAEAVRHKIKSLIDKETADAVLSDDRIVDILRADGVEIARRTVAKYREAMRIPSSVQRRRRMRA
ncbi:MAG: RNA polymerase factor sigma-54 [Caulobacterales bacterium]|nr:RNA polymerase factor sigma-54 [Caulobacterales bacterium]